MQGTKITSVRTRGELIRRFILDNVEAHPKAIVRVTVEKFGITRQATHRHLQNLIHEKAIVPEGNTRSRVYRLAPLSEWSCSFQLEGTTEDTAWRLVAPQLGPLPENVRRIWQHGFTEMFNNVIDHSEATHAFVSLKKTALSTELSIYDQGVGIFRKIQAALGLVDERHAVLELAKGKFTTDPRNHSGEGIFFTSRIFDDFEILSGRVFFTHQVGDEEDWILERDADKETKGTHVLLRLSNHASRTIAQVFDRYSDVDAGFTKTVVPVRLAKYGDDNLVSRSQAKRLLARFDRFRAVVLDFKGLDSVGQAFADQVFRVFQKEHPEIELTAINTEPAVGAMIAHVLAGGAMETALCRLRGRQPR